MTGYLLGRILAYFVLPLLILAIVGAVQYFRTRDKSAALRTALSWWAILLAGLCFLVQLLSQLAKTAL